MPEGSETEMSWTGEGVGTGRVAFLRKVSQFVPELPPEEAAHAVLCTLTERLSGGLVRQIREQLTPDLRDLLAPCARTAVSAREKPFDKDEFYLAIAEHLNVDAEQVRRILFGVCAALEGQITKAEVLKVAAELPDELKGTWLAAHRRAERPA